jgi:hypothetical protein
MSGWVWPAFKVATFGVTAWRYGLDPSNLKGLAEANQGHTYDPSQVRCPSMVVIGQGEYANQEIKRQQAAFLEGVANANKELVVTRNDEGASSHCLGGNRSLMSQIVFDWLDDTLS